MVRHRVKVAWRYRRIPPLCWFYMHMALMQDLFNTPLH